PILSGLSEQTDSLHRSLFAGREYDVDLAVGGPEADRSVGTAGDYRQPTRRQYDYRYRGRSEIETRRLYPAVYRRRPCDESPSDQDAVRRAEGHRAGRECVQLRKPAGGSPVAARYHRETI